ncbi:hypothetical protein OU787_25240 [Kitasatospora sp. YST-16]|nr:hypothetical protein [Kitasatospora sp. YST-16]WAL74505.1 hypothetical protein OU787_25240 [Kitasatospora sp. YST-16]
MAAKATVSARYALCAPYAATATPPRSGPTVWPRFMPMVLRALAAGSCSRGTRRGIIEERAGELTAKNPPWSATAA